MLKEDYISFELAKLIKEKGFNISNISPGIGNWICCMYDENEYIHWGIYDENWYFRLTHQMARRWLRETHGIDIIIDTSNPSAKDRKYYCMIWDGNNNSYILDLFNSYEEAVEAAINYCLENLI